VLAEVRAWDLSLTNLKVGVVQLAFSAKMRIAGLSNLPNVYTLPR
jgi:hypothetical protein